MVRIDKRICRTNLPITSKREELRLAEIDLMRSRDLDGRSTALLVVKKLRAKAAKLRKE
jgi:hypothetical protein